MDASVDNAKILNEYETRVATCYWRDDGILKIVLRDRFHIDLADSKEMFEILKKHSNGRKDMLVMTIAGVDNTQDKEVREFASSDECSAYTFGEAVVLNSLAHKLLVNFILNFYKPARHMKMFNDEQSAVDWLLSLKSEEK